MELSEYIKTIRAHKSLVFIAVGVVTLVSLVVSLLTPPTFVGEAKVLIAEQNAGAAIFGTSASELAYQPERGLSTQMQLMQTRPMAESVVATLGLDVDPEVLLGQVEVQGIGQTNVLVVRATYTDPETAAEIANALSDAYVAWSMANQRDSIAAATREVEVRLAEAESQIAQLSDQLETDGSSAALTAEIAIANGVYSTLSDKLEQLRVNEALATGSGTVVARARANPDPIAPNPARNAILGAVVGIALGLGAALMAGAIDRRIRTPDQAADLMAAPLIGSIPDLAQRNEATGAFVLLGSPNGPVAEAYRLLRNNLGFIDVQTAMRTVEIVSAGPGEGKSSVAVGLAFALAWSGKKVTLVDCDFRRHYVDSILNLGNRVGLSDVLGGLQPLGAATRTVVGVEGLRVVTAGALPPNPAELLGSVGMQSVIADLGRDCDLVILDTPPVLAVADAGAVARWTDGAIVVTRMGVSRKDAVRACRRALEHLGARILGVVACGVEYGRDAEAYGYYAYADADARAAEEGSSRRGARRRVLWLLLAAGAAFTGTAALLLRGT